MADHHDRPNPFLVPQPRTAPDVQAVGDGESREHPLRVIVPQDAPTLTPAAAAVLLRILRAAQRPRIPGQWTSEQDQTDRTDGKRRAA
jgi:hypothetical protein